jgi:hypothetical protein
MANDIKLEGDVDKDFMELTARVVKAISSDFMLDMPDRRKGGGPFRRALVHDENDGLTINFSGDYPGGVTLIGLNTLQVLRDITFGVPGITITGESVMVSVSLAEVITQLEREVLELNNKVAALEARLNN